MFGLQPTHWLIIAVVALVFFAPQRLPELMRALGKTIAEFRTSVQEPIDPKQLESTQPKSTDTTPK